MLERGRARSSGSDNPDYQAATTTRDLDATCPLRCKVACQFQRPTASPWLRNVAQGFAPTREMQTPWRPRQRIPKCDLSSLAISGLPPNESRLSCGALKKESSFLRIYARRQLQALVRRPLRISYRTCPSLRSSPQVWIRPVSSPRPRTKGGNRPSTNELSADVAAS